VSSSTNGVPKNWGTAVLGEIAEVRLGRQRSPKRATGDHMRPYMRAANVTWNGVSLHDVKEMDFTPSEFETYALKAGDILLAEASGSASEVGKPAIWKGEVPNCCFQNTLIRVRADRNLVPFLHLRFLKDALFGGFADASRGVGIHHLGAQAMTEWEVSLPPLPEQHRIVEAIESYFTRLDDAVATLERVQRNLKRYRASVLKAAVEGRLVPTEAELARAEGRDYEPASVLLERILAERRRRWPEAGGRGKYEQPLVPVVSDLPDLPEGWCWATVDALMWDAGYGTSQKCTYEADGPPVLRIPNVQDQSINLDDVKFATGAENLKPEGVVEPGDLLFIRTNGSRGLIGRGAVILQRLPRDHHFASYLIRLRLVNVDAVPRWTGLAWHAPVLRSQILAGAASSAGQYNVSLSAARAFVVPLPPLAEQLRILSEVERTTSLIDASEKIVIANEGRAARLRQSVLKWAFEGRLADQDSSDEPASVLLARIKAERDAAMATKQTGRVAHKKQRTA
jgi:type I restriction enzyme S subunit